MGGAERNPSSLPDLESKSVLVSLTNPKPQREASMKVLFYYRGIESLGVGYLMSYLREQGHEVKLIFDPGLDNNLFMQFGFMEKLNQYDHLLKRAREFSPDIVAVSILTNIYQPINKMIKRFKEELGVPIIAGGPHVSALPDHVIQNDNIDMICIGEGEEAFSELLYRMENGLDFLDTRNIWFKNNGKIIKNEIRNLINDLDTLPFPDKKSFYEYGCFKDNLEIVTGRGCPFRCTFCNIHFQRKLYKGKGKFIRRRSVGNVIDELKHNLAIYDIRYISFHDDNFTTDSNWLEEFSDAYKKEINLPFYCFAYPNTVNRSTVLQLKAANCMQIFMGMDSGDPDIRKNLLKRPMSDEKILRSAALIKESGVRLQLSAIFGFPGEGPDSMYKTVDMVEAAKPDLASGYIFYPFPSTELYEYSIKTGYLGPEEIAKVKRGEGGYHLDSILKHPHRKLAVTMSKLLPIYNKVPMLRSLLRKIIAVENVTTAQLIYIFSIPVTFPFLGIEGVKVTLRMALRAFKMRNEPS
jgi:anaerobic magnesium-protoporphyrin IX monomethyl ester cyclase